jgi:hypothetical protein
MSTREQAPRRVYLDTSAYLRVLLDEEGSQRVAEQTGGAELLSSVLLMLEARRNLIRLTREGTLTPEKYQACMARVETDARRFVFRDLTLDLCEANTVPAIAIPRSLDLVHLRTALWFHAAKRIDRFMTMDTSQQAAAKELGLPL